MKVGDVRALETEFSKEPNIANILKLINAYVEQRDARSLEKALSLILTNLERYGQEPVFLDRATNVLVLIKDNAEAARLVVELTKRLIQLEPDQLKWYVNAAYSYWRLGNLAAAIEMSELALRQFKHVTAEDEVITSVKGNLAYYYAERALEEDADKARNLAAEAYKAKSTASRADTLGYVHLRFAKTRGDLENAQRYFTIAEEKLRKLGLPDLLVAKHLKEVQLKLENWKG